MDKYEEEQVVEFNLLDHELDKLRDEKQELLCELEAVKNENEILKQDTDESLDDEKINRIQKDYQLIKEQLTKIESLYKNEMSRRDLYRLTLTRKRISEQPLSLIWPISALFSMTPSTQFLPAHVQESVGRSVRLSIEY